MKLAAQLYGDATQWNRIAAINELWDFIIVGTVTLTIPARQ
jgi:nucleoid-associated protein YgaU